MTNSREKGKRGEREFAAFLRSTGFDARRTQQFSGDAGTADVDSSIDGVHWEVKRRSGIASLRFMEQAERDSLESIPVVAMREDRGPWHLLILAEDLERFARKIVDALDE
jgi:Holliday junction resolvase